MALCRWEENRLRLKSASLELLFEQSPLAFVAILLNAFLFISFSWNLISHSFLVSWFGGILSVTAVRIVLRHFWMKRKNRITVKDVDSILRIFLVMTAISGGLWGAIGPMSVMTDSPSHIAMTCFILAGMSAGAVGAYAVHAPAARSYIVFAIFPITVALFGSGSQENAVLGGMAALYLVLMTMVARNVNRRTIKAMELGFENQNLVARLNDASHEIRTPVTAIVGAAEIIATDSRLPSDLRSLSEIVHRQSQFLRLLVENLLTIKRLEGGEEELKEETSSIREEMEFAGGLVAADLKRKGLQLRISFSERVPPLLILDRLKFRQVLINLLSNAVKFTEKGSISIDLDYRYDEQLIVRVTDTGIGVAPEVQDRIFDPFFRDKRAQSFEGAGLGLAIAQNLARMMGGNLKLARSEVQRGSTFELSVRATAPLSGSVRAPLQGRRIVIIDDKPDLAQVYRRKLVAQGADVLVLNSAVDFLRAFQRHEIDVELVLLDIEMPGLNGFEALRRMRDAGFARPVIAFTAYDADFSRQKCLTSGFDDYMTKSESSTQFLERVRHWIGDRSLASPLP